jgi:hypothetical protein
MTSDTVDELHCLRRGIAVWWGSLAAGFKAYWTRLLSPAHRETILLAGFEAAYQSEHGHVYSKFLLDFQVSKLLANNGQPFLTFIENVLQRGFMDFDTSIPSLNNELGQTISDWIAELKEENEYDKYKGDYLVYLKVLIHFSQAIFALRFLSQVMELWSAIATDGPIEPAPAQVYQENSVKIKVIRTDQGLPIWWLALTLNSTIPTAYLMLPPVPPLRMRPRSLPRGRVTSAGGRMLKRRIRRETKKRRPKSPV